MGEPLTFQQGGGIPVLSKTYDEYESMTEEDKQADILYIIEKEGDFSLLNLAMTSDTTPSPYVASASSIISSDGAAYKAFDGIISATSINDTWHSNTSPPQWIKLEFGRYLTFSGIQIIASNAYSTHYLYAPKDFTVTAHTADGDVIVYTATNEPGWNPGEQRDYIFESPVLADSIQVDISSTSGNYVAIMEIKFYVGTARTSYILVYKGEIVAKPSYMSEVTTAITSSLDDI